MRNLPILMSLILLMASCGGSKKALSTLPEATPEAREAVISIPAVAPDTLSSEPVITTEIAETEVPEVELAPEVRDILRTALSYNGIPYRYGGTTRKGMDCSGLVFTTFQHHDIILNRSSATMATQGKEIPLKNVKKGDLLFFTTGSNRKRINHVGLVVETEHGDIQFIHATISRGVLISSLKEGYWQHAFHHARRVL